MVSGTIDGDYVAAVYDKLTDNPTAQDLDFLIEARAIIGNYVATAEYNLEKAKADKKIAEAEEVIHTKEMNPKWTQQQVESQVYLNTRVEQTVENVQKLQYAKLKSLLESLTEAINGIKFLGRMGGM